MRAALHLAILGAKGACYARQEAGQFRRQRVPASIVSHQRTNNVLEKSAPHTSTHTSGPLAGIRIVEFAGIGPGPFARMMLADMGAEVVTLDRVGARQNLKSVSGRGRKMVELDLKDKASIAEMLDLLANADALIEGFRPGVMERLRLGPRGVEAPDPRLV